MGDRRLENLSPDVVEINVESFGGELGDPDVDVLVLVVDSAVELQDLE